MSNFNSFQNPTKVNLDAEKLDSPCVQDNAVPSQYSHCENKVVFKYFSLGLIIGVNWSTSTERVRSPRDGYFNVKRVHGPHDYKNT